MVAEHDRGRFFEAPEILDDLKSDGGVFHDDFPLEGGQGAGLVEDFRGNARLADIVEKGSPFKDDQGGLFHVTQDLREKDRIGGHSARVGQGVHGHPRGPDQIQQA